TLPSYDATDRARIPLFVREGAIVPTRSAVLVWPGPTASRFVVHDEDDATTTLEAQATATGARVTFSRVRAETVVRAHLRGGVVEVPVAASTGPRVVDVP